MALAAVRKQKNTPESSINLKYCVCCERILFQSYPGSERHLNIFTLTFIGGLTRLTRPSVAATKKPKCTNNNYGCAILSSFKLFKNV